MYYDAEYFFLLVVVYILMLMKAEVEFNVIANEI